MTKIQLTRIVKPVLVITEGDCRIDQKAKTVAVTFEGPNGDVISVAFDGRCDRDSAGGSMVRETYELYRDCPIMAGDGDQGPMQDVETLRVLRDALVGMDLQDKRFRLREYNRSGSTSYSYGDDYDALSDRVRVVTITPNH
ncbi:MAG: hypothetical protein ACYS7Y_27350 [Planctomycetota bacterium]|jgi:hypothetical protein